MKEDIEESVTGLAYTDNMSISWKVVDYHPDDSHLALVNESNESFLRAVSAISEFTKDLSDVAPGLSHEIARLDLKLNLVLDLVSQLVYKQLDIPDICRVTVTSGEVMWGADNVPPPNKMIFVQLYIQHGTPKPLCFYGQVVTSVDDFASGKARVNFVGLSGPVQQWLDKLIFRHHRREVAFKKAANSDAKKES